MNEKEERFRARYEGKPSIDKRAFPRDALTCIEWDKVNEVEKWVKDIPEISFPSWWKVKIIPPFGGALVRFIVTRGKAEVSVYLDGYDRLGYYGSPYWEVYPVSGDVERVYMNDVDVLLKVINKSIQDQTE